MSEAVVPVSVLEAHALPPMCARHGQPASRSTTRIFHRRGPVWLVPLLVLSFFAALLVEQFVDSRSRIRCQLYECAECSRQRQRMRLWAVGVWIAFLLAFVLAVGHGQFMLLAMALLVAAPVASFALPRRAVVQGWVTRDRQAIVLTPVSPAFLAALHSTTG